jgi:C4-dicarboxylate-specific signal transduction histidine kinase
VNEQIRGAVLAAIAAVMGWLAITSVGLLIQVSSLQVTTTTLKESQALNSERDHRLEDKLRDELKELRALIEEFHGRK